MKYFSEVTKEVYDSVDDLTKAENDVKKKTDDRAKRAKEVEDAIKAANEAHDKANEMLNAFLKDYGSYHTTFTSTKSGMPKDFKNNLFSDLFSFWF